MRFGLMNIVRVQLIQTGGCVDPLRTPNQQRPKNKAEIRSRSVRRQQLMQVNPSVKTSSDEHCSSVISTGRVSVRFVSANVVEFISRLL